MACALLVTGYLGFVGSVSLLLPLAIALVWLGLTAWGAFDIRLGYFGPTYWRGNQQEVQHIALTFDDGPTPYTPKVLALLKKYNMQATFFCIGRQLEEHPEIAVSIMENGHQIGNHSYSHSKQIGFFGLKEMLEEITHTDQIIKEVCNITTTIYRPPFGVTNPTIARATKQLDKDVIGWSIRSLDTVIKEESSILKRIIPRLKPGAIVLLHDTSESTVHLLEQLLIYMERKKLKSVTVDELLKKRRK